MGVTHPPRHSPAPAQHPWKEGLWGAGPKAAPVPRRPGGLSLPLVAMHGAQLLGIPGASSPTWLPGTNLVLFLLSQAVACDLKYQSPIFELAEVIFIQQCWVHGGSLHQSHAHRGDFSVPPLYTSYSDLFVSFPRNCLHIHYNSEDSCTYLMPAQCP